MTFKSVGNALNCDHATVIHGNKQCRTFLSMNYPEYVDAMLNWRMVFDDNEINLDQSTNPITRIESRITSLLDDAIEYANVTEEDVAAMLTVMLRNYIRLETTEEE